MTDFTQNATGVPPSEPILPTMQEYLVSFSHHPVEIVNGEIIPMHPPNREHVRIAHRLLFSLEKFITAHDLGEVYTEAPFILDASEAADWVRNSRIPDVAFIAKSRIDDHDSKYPAQAPWRLAPDVAVEVISPNDTYQEIDDKIADYIRYGVKLIVVINPRNRTVRLVNPQTQATQTLTDNDELTLLPVIGGWSMPVAELFD